MASVLFWHAERITIDTVDTMKNHVHPGHLPQPRVLPSTGRSPLPHRRECGAELGGGQHKLQRPDLNPLDYSVCSIWRGKVLLGYFTPQRRRLQGHGGEGGRGRLVGGQGSTPASPAMSGRA